MFNYLCISKLIPKQTEELKLIVIIMLYHVRDNTLLCYINTLLCEG